MCLCSHASWRPNSHVVLWGLEHLYLPGAVLGPLVQQRQSIPACPWTCPHSKYSRPRWPGLREATAGSQKDWPGKEGRSLTEERSEPTELSLKVRLHPLLSGKITMGIPPMLGSPGKRQAGVRRLLLALSNRDVTRNWSRLTHRSQLMGLLRTVVCGEGGGVRSKNERTKAKIEPV